MHKPSKYVRHAIGESRPFARENLFSPKKPKNSVWSPPPFSNKRGSLSYAITFGDQRAIKNMFDQGVCASTRFSNYARPREPPTHVILQSFGSTPPHRHTLNSVLIWPYPLMQKCNHFGVPTNKFLSKVWR